MFNHGRWPLLAVGLALLFITHHVAGDTSKAAASPSSSSSNGTTTSGRYVRLQLEDLEMPDGDAETAVQHDEDDEFGAFPGVVGSDCLPLATDGDLSSICTRSAARYPDLFDHVDEEHSSARLRHSAGDWLNFLRSPPYFPQNVQLSADAAVTSKLCRSRLTTFFCAMYTPPCSSRSLRQTADRFFSRQIPCRQMCESARNGCNLDVHRQISSVVPRDWPDQWTCRLIPGDLMCDYSLHTHQRSIYGMLLN